MKNYSKEIMLMKKKKDSNFTKVNKLLEKIINLLKLYIKERIEIAKQDNPVYTETFIKILDDNICYIFNLLMNNKDIKTYIKKVIGMNNDLTDNVLHYSELHFFISHESELFFKKLKNEVSICKRIIKHISDVSFLLKYYTYCIRLNETKRKNIIDNLSFVKNLFLKNFENFQNISDEINNEIFFKVIYSMLNLKNINEYETIELQESVSIIKEINNISSNSSNTTEESVLYAVRKKGIDNIEISSSISNISENSISYTDYKSGIHDNDTFVLKNEEIMQNTTNEIENIITNVLDHSINKTNKKYCYLSNNNLGKSSMISQNKMDLAHHFNIYSREEDCNIQNTWHEELNPNKNMTRKNIRVFEENFSFKKNNLESENYIKKGTFLGFKDIKDECLNKYEQKNFYISQKNDNKLGDNAIYYNKDNIKNAKISKGILNNNCIDNICYKECNTIMHLINYTKTVMYKLKDSYAKDVQISEQFSNYYYYGKKIKYLFPEYSFSMCKKIVAAFEELNENPIYELSRLHIIEQFCKKNNCEKKNIPKILRLDLRETIIDICELIEEIELLDIYEIIDKYKNIHIYKNGFISYYDVKHPFVCTLFKFDALLCNFVDKLQKYSIITTYFDYDADKIIRNYSSQISYCFRKINYYLNKFSKLCVSIDYKWNSIPEIKYDFQKIKSENEVDVSINDKILNGVLLKYKKSIEDGTYNPHPNYDFTVPGAFFCIYLYTTDIYSKVCSSLIERNVEITKENNLISKIIFNKYGIDLSTNTLKTLDTELENYNQQRKQESSNIPIQAIINNNIIIETKKLLFINNNKIKKISAELIYSDDKNNTSEETCSYDHLKFIKSDVPKLETFPKLYDDCISQNTFNENKKKRKYKNKKKEEESCDDKYSDKICLKKYKKRYNNLLFSY
ncbi:hypothetical protein PRELSG_1260400 [Plasmodium relictum]|uniref:Uncharacterized protein n=1 Tax=Plasmodium relictum TaxID=85471 RepID=A0A1J1HAS3_PLARL|nr:hypothetical protein PRELSG_1260400 [Plasmodium relictum]CRH01711.1 hypothetical protein PRELSG_1260400 [Plasmodium relictum]